MQSNQLSLNLNEDIKKSMFKDECDECKKYTYCHGYNNQVLCNDCLKKKRENNDNK